MEKKICELELRNIDLMTALKACVAGDASKMNEDLAQRHEEVITDINQIIGRHFGVEVKTEPKEHPYYDEILEFKKTIDWGEDFQGEMKEEKPEMENVHPEEVPGETVSG